MQSPPVAYDIPVSVVVPASLKAHIIILTFIKWKFIFSTKGYPCLGRRYTLMTVNQPIAVSSQKVSAKFCPTASANVNAIENVRLTK